MLVEVMLSLAIYVVALQPYVGVIREVATQTSKTSLCTAPFNRHAHCVTITGTDSSIQFESYYRIQDQDGFLELMSDHLGCPCSDKKKHLDFSRYELLCLFDGRNINNHGMLIDSICSCNGQIIVTYQMRYYQSGESGDKTTSYCIIMLPKIAKEIVIVEKVQVQIGGPNTLQEKCRLTSRH